MFYHVCENCKKKFESKKRVKRFCCDSCFQEYRKRPDVKAETIKKRKRTCMEKYGVDNAAKSNSVKLKTELTCIQKYGVKSPTLNKEIKEKQIKTCIEKYGHENAMSNSDIQRKMTESCEVSFGYKYALQSEKIKKKTKLTNIEKYGVENVAQSTEIQEKIKQTNRERYGCDSPLQSESMKLKRIESKRKHIYSTIVDGNRLPDNIQPQFTYEEYIDSSRSNEYPFKCMDCGNIFNDHLSNGRIPRCLVCNPHKRDQSTSKCESEIVEFIKSFYNGNIIQNTYSVISPLEIDIFLPEHSIAIEFNGLYWHSQLSGNKYKNYHINKTYKCNQKGIRLIHIFEDEWVFKSEIVKEKLKSIISNCIDKVYARNCCVKIIDTKQKNEFLDKTHIQGQDKSKIKLGAFHNNELVAVMTFSNNRMVMGGKSNENEYELIRYSTSKHVVGGAGKLLKYFIRNYNPSKITSYADKRFSNGKLYESIGFSKSGDTPPNYWYMDNSYSERKYRFQFSKQNLKKKLRMFNPELSEWENMKLNGYDRIWDCGSIKYEMVL